MYFHSTLFHRGPTDTDQIRSSTAPYMHDHPFCAYSLTPAPRYQIHLLAGSLLRRPRLLGCSRARIVCGWYCPPPFHGHQSPYPSTPLTGSTGTGPAPLVFLKHVAQPGRVMMLTGHGFPARSVALPAVIRLPACCTGSGGRRSMSILDAWYTAPVATTVHLLAL